MTSRERLIAAVTGGDVDRRPVISYPSAPEDDAVIVPPDEVSAHQNQEKLVLADVANPFQQGFYDALRLAPIEARGLLDAAVDSVRSFMSLALKDGADGIFYRLNGATAKESTPMQYGGLFLEHDRTLLEEVAGASCNVLYVVGGEEDVYLDFVSDLPAHLFAWDACATGLDSAYVRSLREGTQASSDPLSEVELRLTPDASRLTP